MTRKELDTLERAIQRAEAYAQKYANTEDGGTCNFDAPAIKVEASEKQMKMLDWVTYKWGKRDTDGRTWYVLDLNLSGQGNRRTRMAEAVCEYLKLAGYKTMMYYQMD